jgi:hypothetical protein
MALDSKIGVTNANAMLDAINAVINGGAGLGIINIYTTPMPATCAAAPTGTLLGTCVFGATPFQAAASNSINANAITDDTSADTTGVAFYYRVYDANGTDATKGTCHFQGTAGEAADTTNLTLDDKNIVVGGTISITDYDITLPLE